MLTRYQIVRGRSASDLSRCHTVLALQFMQANYPTLDIRYPD